ncbi:unnamed protein product [Didymodactylos carnosus]|uniref:Uncharacterized protein n=1 Tax=Didymodactylos carnosus TaxID=1234261 RepID=A0A813RBQ4_9BILA|nr:unnamed protein product [Didymodactylos carnosus]CAF0803420.1 unnamed protein product [Didymodactylos carnosus]CAF3561818.1 unnamed protein product [Didymodactylos carnosus]CAF3586922.1 unnamed protein product [Didymodactylos carnosus]
MSFLTSLAQKAYDVAGNISGGRDYLATAANRLNQVVKGKDAQVYLKPGNIIQFICRSSGRTIQIVMSATSNELVPDAIGGSGSYYPNSHFLVVCSQYDRYYFHNNYNYLGLKNHQPCIVPSSFGTTPPEECEFRVHDMLGSATHIYLESVQSPGFFLSFDENGAISNEAACKLKDKNSQFQVSLIAYGPGITPVKDDGTIEASTEQPPPPYYAATAGETTTGSSSPPAGDTTK